MTTMVKSVCYKCPSRTVGCHIYCTDYLEEQKKRVEIREMKMRDEDFYAYQKKHKTRIEGGGLKKRGV